MDKTMMKAIRMTVKNYLDSIPERQFVTGAYATTVGINYVNFICTWNGTQKSRMPIVDFYNQYVK